LAAPRSRTVIGATAARLSGGGGRDTRRGGATEQQAGNGGVQEDQKLTWSALGRSARREVVRSDGMTTAKLGQLRGRLALFRQIGAFWLALLGGEDADEAAVLPSGPAELGEAGSHGDLRMEEASGRSRIQCAGMPSSTFAPSYRNYTPSWPARSSWCRLRRPCTNRLLADGP
jgi:hypothetical protein